MALTGEDFPVVFPFGGHEEEREKATGEGKRIEGTRKTTAFTKRLVHKKEIRLEYDRAKIH